MWGFTCNADGEMTYDLGGKGPYVHAMSTVSRSMKETDKLRGLLCGEDNTPSTGGKDQQLSSPIEISIPFIR